LVLLLRLWRTVLRLSSVLWVTSLPLVAALLSVTLTNTRPRSCVTRPGERLLVPVWAVPGLMKVMSGLRVTRQVRPARALRSGPPVKLGLLKRSLYENPVQNGFMPFRCWCC
jgi:peptidoglycan/LPS O-acetylase OafA/YrhL